jgi:formylglycine-generating enzyme required for sulfatase activity
MSDKDELAKIEAAIKAQEASRGILDDEMLDAAIAALEEKRAAYLAEHSMYIGKDAKDSTLISGNDNVVDQSTHNYYGEPPAESLPLDEATEKYLNLLISNHQKLKLQGIRAGSQPLSVALEKVYVSLSILDKSSGSGSQPKGERVSDIRAFDAEMHSGYLSVASALQRYRRLVIIGDPGSGKTTLLAYLTLTYARDRQSASGAVHKRLNLEEADTLPIFLPLRDLGYHLKEKNNHAGKDGPAVLLDYLREYYQMQQIALPKDFFNEALEKGKAVLLLDGMDEVADKKMRQRVARLIETFAARYPDARYVVTSREVGYEGAARVGAEFGLAKVRDFSPAEVRRFLRDWTRVVETTLAHSVAAPNELNKDELLAVLEKADKQSKSLSNAIDNNARVAELAVNPLLLTVIALVHRYRAKLPERRSELYEEAVEVLLGHWDSAKGMEDELDVVGIKLDSGDRRSFLEPVAFWMHERERREIELHDLKTLLLPRFVNMTGDAHRAEKAVDAFIRMIEERSGLLIARGIGIYGFAHLTFQEYLAARALAGREDALAFTLKILPDAWWREVILLEVGYVSSQGPSRVSKLIAAIMNADVATEPEPHHHLLLAAECLFDVGLARVEGDLLGEVRKRLQKEADAPIKKGNKESVLGKVSAMNALARIETGKFNTQYWKAPWGEPQWVTIPAGEFWMGDDSSQYDDEKPAHKVYLPEYEIARVPVTNAQYELYVQDTGKDAPEHWRGGNVPKGLGNHPVVNVSWYAALDYCAWLSEKLDKEVSLPSEAQWEKAAKGAEDQRLYPWGKWQELHCNNDDLGLKETTPVGLFLKGASPYGLLDMSGNVWEWTRSIWDEEKYKYPYQADDGRENMERDDKFSRVLRGGSFFNFQFNVRCAFRDYGDPFDGYYFSGFRIVVSPFLSS